MLRSRPAAVIQGRWPDSWIWPAGTSLGTIYSLALFVQPPAVVRRWSRNDPSFQGKNDQPEVLLRAGSEERKDGLEGGVMRK